MNEIPSSPQVDPQPTAPSRNETMALPAGSPGRKGQLAQNAIVAALIVLTLLVAMQWWKTRNELRFLRKEVAQRLQSHDLSNTETKSIARSVQDGMKDVQSKLNLLESKQVEAQSQQVALEQLYQELYKNRDDWTLSEIEQVLSTASQQLQLAGNVQGALIALQNADSRLARLDKPQFIFLRRAIAKDMERLKALPGVDLAGTALRIDTVISQIDKMPLLADEKTSLPATQPKNARGNGSILRSSTGSSAASASAAGDWLADFGEKWRSWTNEMWVEIRQLIRVRNVQNPDALLLSPTEAFYVRENLKLRLLNARLALLSRNESAFRSDVIAAQDIIAKYFDTRAKQTQATQSLLKQVQASNLAIDLPTLSESLDAVRNYYKAKP
ncbi:uroporphyrinogen-III C-methyltransferase [Oxalobacteraceae bacterium R-40]|uniref:Uroporphyrinogen-III C-methyltransferase n=1 Tax=Keguizhuia sedimenti TaxID=3064264 RepID=A0ABU1BPP8_9BURK|nr:uroporphyrinogen-III C-methyltransferase [Oxalobacteraceae bacterium R-40]